MEEKLKFISENSSQFTQRDWSLINRLYRKINAKVQAKQEINEVLSDALYSYSDALSVQIDLYELQQLLSDYLAKKGLKQSLIKSEEMQSMIANDIRTNENHRDNINDLIGGLKKL